ncbi:MAG: substrate-binding domain-containing protein [Christensenellales bacterium]
MRGNQRLWNILSGVYPYGSYGGEVYYDGELCKFRNVRESEKKNIAIIHQHLALFPALSIAENIFLGNENAKNSVIDWKLTIRRAAELMERVGLHENPETKIRDLGVGKQQLVEICKAISKNVRLLILDEPTAALNDEESALLLELMRKFRQEGISCIFITHKLHEIMLVSNTKNVSYYVTDNLYDCGRLQGEYIVKALDLDNTTESFNLELFSGDPADSNAPYFFNGAYDALSPYIESGKLNVLSGQIERDVTATADWDGLKAQERMDTILSTYYKGDTRIDAVMCNNDAIALGVLASLKNVGYGTAEKPFPVITGMDCDIANIKAIKSGEISMTVFKDNRIIAKKAAEVMDCVLHDKTPQAGDAFETTFNNGVCDVTAFLIAPEVIDKDNYQAALFDSGYYSEDQLK